MAKLPVEWHLWRYEKTKEQSRELRPFERGYWSVDTSGWAEATHEKTWGNLTDYLTRGLAGWDTWCVRDADKRELRAYCFGASAMYIFFLLYMVTHPIVKHCGTAWYDAQGKPVIRVKPRRGGRRTEQ